MGAKAWTFILGLKPYLLIKMHLRRSKCLERPHCESSCKEMFVGSILLCSFSWPNSSLFSSFSISTLVWIIWNLSNKPAMVATQTRKIKWIVDLKDGGEEEWERGRVYFSLFLIWDWVATMAENYAKFTMTTVASKKLKVF